MDTVSRCREGGLPQTASGPRNLGTCTRQDLEVGGEADEARAQLVEPLAVALELRLAIRSSNDDTLIINWFRSTRLTVIVRSGFSTRKPWILFIVALVPYFSPLSGVTRLMEVLIPAAGTW